MGLIHSLIIYYNTVADGPRIGRHGNFVSYDQNPVLNLVTLQSLVSIRSLRRQKTMMHSSNVQSTTLSLAPVCYDQVSNW